VRAAAPRSAAPALRVARHARARYIPRVVKLPLVYRFKLSDREFASAWVREYYRRPGVRVLRIFSGPGLVAFGVATATRATETFTRVMAIVSVLFGIWLTVKPFLMAWAMTSRRRRTNRANVEMEVRFDRHGMRVSDGERKTDFAWEKLSAAGVGSDYVWLELKTGTRATIPRRAIDDLDALRELLRTHVEWRG
jgi:hypothetical protein